MQVMGSDIWSSTLRDSVTQHRPNGCTTDRRPARGDERGKGAWDSRDGTVLVLSLGVGGGWFQDVSRRQALEAGRKDTCQACSRVCRGPTPPPALSCSLLLPDEPKSADSNFGEDVACT